MNSYYVAGFQDFKFEYKYDLIWLQWFLMYLTDDDLIQKLKECAENLSISQETG